MKAFSKRLLSLTMATAMVFSLTAVPSTEAEAASKYSITQKTSVQANKTYTFSLKGVAKTQYAKVYKTSGVTVKKGSTTLKNGAKLKGTGKTISLKVKASDKLVGKKCTVKAKIYNTKSKKLVKTVASSDMKVNYSATSVKLDQTALTLKAGETATLKATMAPAKTNSKIKTWTTSDANVATVKDGVVTAVGGGTATITVKTSNGKTATATVTVEGEKKPEAFTLTASATKADTITGTLSREVKDATVEVKKGTTTVDGKATFNGTEVVFKGTANFTNGTYTITVKEGELSASYDVTVQDLYVKEIVIKSTQALTNEKKPAPGSKITAGSEAYIYYDVLDQYGDSLRSSTNINWTTSAHFVSADKATGKIVVTNGDPNGTTDLTPFTYGTQIYVTGVYTKTGAVVSTSVPVGLPQSLDSVKAVGFINVNQPTKLLENLPSNFTKDTYRMLYLTYDQDGNILDAGKYLNSPAVEGSESKVTLISDKPLLLDSKFEDDVTYTVDGIEYSSVKLNPGQYSDRGGEVNITAISNKTGRKTVSNFVIGEGALLQKLVISAPTDIIAKGDTDVTLPFKAYDTKGNEVTNYETIVRSTNELSITCNPGYVRISENDDGTACIKWFDNRRYDTNGNVVNTGSQYDFTDSNGVEDYVTITTVVVGGESSNVMLGLQDTRVPVAIKSVKINGSEKNIITGATYELDFLSDNVTYVDQYGKTHVNGPKWWYGQDNLVGEFFKFNSSKMYGTGSNAAYYGIQVELDKTETLINNNGQTGEVGYKTILPGSTTMKSNINVLGNAIASSNIKYSIVANDDANKAVDKWSPAGKTAAVSYTLVPVGKLGGLDIKDLGVQQMETAATSFNNLADYEAKQSGKVNPAVDAVDQALDGTRQEVKVAGTYMGETLTLPTTLWSEDPSTELTINGANRQLKAISGNNIKWNELYDTNSARLTRKNATRKVVVAVGDSKLEKKVALSDALPYVDSVELLGNNVINPYKATLNVNGCMAGHFETIFNTVGYFDYSGDKILGSWGMEVLVVKDQYGNRLHLNQVDLSYKLSNYTENVEEFAHLLNTSAISKNGSKDAAVSESEIKDTFKLEITVNGNNDKGVYGSKTITVDKVTVGADGMANIESNLNTPADKTFREDVLKYYKKQ